MIKKLIIPIILGLVMFAAAFGGAFWYHGFVKGREANEIKTVTSASLAGLQEQARLTVFLARFVAVVSSTKEKLGLSAERTMIMPGTVRYEIDLKALKQKDLVWDADEKQLSITLPPLIISGPDVDYKAVRQYGQGGILTLLTDAQSQLDEHNRIEAQVSLIEQAKAQMPMDLAKESARKAVERSFALPLRAAGIKAKVTAHFTGEASAEGGGEPNADTEEH